MKLIAQKLGRIALVVYSLGIRGALTYMGCRLKNMVSHGNDLAALTAPQSMYPLKARLGSSDLDVFGQIFVNREYRDLITNEFEVKWIFDCGANVGYTTAFLASAFKNARIIALEPDPENFELLKENVAPWGDRITPVLGGVWSSDRELMLVRGEFGDGREWATQTRKAAFGEEPDVTVYSISTLMARFGVESIDILKIDIEGGEEALFSENTEDWLCKTRSIAIELHGLHCAHAFYAALKRQDSLFQFKTYRELTIANKLT